MMTVAESCCGLHQLQIAALIVIRTLQVVIVLCAAKQEFATQITVSPPFFCHARFLGLDRGRLGKGRRAG